MDTQGIKIGSRNMTTVGKVLLRRLKEAGVDDIFGVPGDFVLGFFNEIISSDINYIGTCNELNAAYAADGYARIKGIGCVSTTYCVGELSAINGIAGSYAEDVSVVIITGCPARDHYAKGTLLHHTLGDYNAPRAMFEHITVANVLLTNAETALSKIDEALTACLRQKKPVYIGICSDIVQEQCPQPLEPFVKPVVEVSSPEALEEAVYEAVKKVNESRLPILIPGIGISRYGLVNEFAKLVEISKIPFTTMMLGKAILNEEHPMFIGLYCGDRSREYVRRRVEESDCVIIFGEKFTDFNTGGFSSVFDNRRTINVMRNKVQISYHTYDVYIHDFLKALTKHIIPKDPTKLEIQPAFHGCIHTYYRDMVIEHSKKLTMNKLFDRFAHFIPENSIVIAETGASLFSAIEVLMPKGVCFIGQAFYGSIGYTVGACLGACIAQKEKTVILFIGDGSFQVTAQDVSTMIRNNCRPIIVLINNDGYTIERVIVDNEYNNIQMWKYSKIPEVFGGGESYIAKTEGELEEALKNIQLIRMEKLCFLEVFLDKWDCNETLRKSGKLMACNNKLI